MPKKAKKSVSRRNESNKPLPSQPTPAPVTPPIAQPPPQAVAASNYSSIAVQLSAPAAQAAAPDVAMLRDNINQSFLALTLRQQRLLQYHSQAQQQSQRVTQEAVAFDKVSSPERRAVLLQELQQERSACQKVEQQAVAVSSGINELKSLYRQLVGVSLTEEETMQFQVIKQKTQEQIAIVAEVMRMTNTQLELCQKHTAELQDGALFLAAQAEAKADAPLDEKALVAALHAAAEVGDVKKTTQLARMLSPDQVERLFPLQSTPRLVAAAAGREAVAEQLGVVQSIEQTATTAQEHLEVLQQKLTEIRKKVSVLMGIVASIKKHTQELLTTVSAQSCVEALPQVTALVAQLRENKQQLMAIAALCVDYAGWRKRDALRQPSSAQRKQLTNFDAEQARYFAWCQGEAQQHEKTILALDRTIRRTQQTMYAAGQAGSVAAEPEPASSVIEESAVASRP